MAINNYGTGTVYLRGDIWWVKVYVDNKQIFRSSKSKKNLMPSS